MSETTEPGVERPVAGLDAQQAPNSISETVAGDDDEAHAIAATATSPRSVEPERAQVALFSTDEATRLREHWDAVQAGFVDEPRKAVQDADGLVEVATKHLVEMFAVERGRLEAQWGRGEDVTTEDLRLALRRYRSFFGRLLAI